MNQPSPAAPAPMEGHGAYNRSSRVQASVAAPAIALFEQAAGAVPLAGDGPVVIVDYGASEGRNSLAPISAALEVLRGRMGSARAVSVVHTDLPGNDFSALFRLLQQDDASYLRGDPAVFPSAIGRSFYEALLPPDSVTLGWSSWAVQWLSRTPGPVPDHVQVAFSRDAKARQAYDLQAAADWELFLTHRARELRSGGRLVVLTMGKTDDGHFGYEPVVGSIYAALLGLVEQGAVSREEAGRMAIPTVGRTRAELAAPFADGDFEGLVLEHLDVSLSEDRIWSDFQTDGDVNAFAARWSVFSRASVLPTLAANLDGDDPHDPRRARFIDEMEAGMRARLKADPRPSLLPMATLVIAKT